MLALEDEVFKLTASNKTYETSVNQLETDLQQESDTNKSLQSQVNTLGENKTSLEKSVSELQSVKEQQEVKIESLQKELSQCRTELALTQRVGGLL